MQVKRKAKADDEAQGGAGDRPTMPVRDVTPLALNEAAALRDLARNGGGAVFVDVPRTVQLVALSRLVSAGLAEAQQVPPGARQRARLTPAGVNRLTEAAQRIAEGVRAQ